MKIVSRLRAVIAMLLLAGPIAARADAVADWAEFADRIDAGAHRPGEPFDTAAFLGTTRTSLAMFEAADSIDRRYGSFLRLPPAAAGASVAVAVATAAHDVLAASFPAARSAIDDRYALAMAAAQPGSATTTGIAAGRAAAVAALAAGGVDPAASLAPYQPSTQPGRWQATAPTALDPHYAAMTPWFMASAAAFRLAPPPALDDPRLTRDIAEVHRMGGKTSTERSPDDTMRAWFWANDDIAPALRAVAFQPGRSLVRNARFYALTALVARDISIANAEAKLHYGFWRPFQAIHAGGGGAAPDTAWEPLLRTPLHPEYPCGHCVFAAGLASVIEAEGAPPAGLPFSNAAMRGVVVTVATPADYVTQVSFSRICAGVHYRSTTVASEAMARRIAANAIARFAPLL